MYLMTPEKQALPEYYFNINRQKGNVQVVVFDSDGAVEKEIRIANRQKTSLGNTVGEMSFR